MSNRRLPTVGDSVPSLEQRQVAAIERIACAIEHLVVAQRASVEAPMELVLLRPEPRRKSMHALCPQQRADILACIDEAVTAVRRSIEVEPNSGPGLVWAFRCLSDLKQYKEVVLAMPLVMREEPHA